MCHLVGQVKLRQLLDNLLGLQKLALLNNKEICSIVGGASEGSHGNNEQDSDEEIPSDSDVERGNENDVISSESESEDKEISTSAAKHLKRKRNRPDWVIFWTDTIRMCGATY